MLEGERQRRRERNRKRERDRDREKHTDSEREREREREKERSYVICKAYRLPETLNAAVLSDSLDELAELLGGWQE